MATKFYVQIEKSVNRPVELFGSLT